MKRAALTDTSRVEELWYADRCSGERSTHCIQLSTLDSVLTSMLHNIEAVSGLGKNTPIVLLTLHGDTLEYL